MTSPTTICVNCIHFINKETGGPRADIWYNHLCAASPLEKSIDPVTGKETYMIINSLGMRVGTDNAYQYCRDVNDGNCPKFEPHDIDLHGSVWDEIEIAD